MLKILKTTAKSAFVLLLILFIYGTPLPKKSAILPEILRGEPHQELIPDGNKFQKKYDEFTYEFTPHAKYRIQGLVVALHHSDSWIDISHENDPAQTMDICVVWGANISTNAYRAVSYSHGDWTCYYSWDSNPAPAFRGDLLSNSHLIPHTKEGAKLIKSIKVGDQIVLSGTLTDYSTTDRDGNILGSRNTSLVRTDTGNGACEILYLREVTILKRNMPWRTPLINTLYAIIVLWFVAEIYLSIPKRKDISETITGKPHVPNPNDIKNFIGERVFHRKHNVASELPIPPTKDRDHTPEQQ